MNGIIYYRYEYDSFGNPTFYKNDYTQTYSYPLSNYNNLLFTGREVDILDSGSLKIQYNRNRSYDYYTGRWLQRDPIGVNPAGGKENPFRVLKQYKDGLNLYEYVQSNPIIRTDGFGLDCGIFKYRNEGHWYAAHRGLLVDTADIDFGPNYPNILDGMCSWPWGGPEANAEKQELKKRKYGNLRVDYRTIKPCKCATCGDIKSCIRYSCSKWDKKLYIYPINNCLAFMLETIAACCLE